MTKTTRYTLIIIAAIIVLAAIQWYTTSRPTAYFNEYGNDATTTPATATTTANQSVTTPDAAAAAVAPVANVNKSTKNFMHTITIQTNKGTIVIETYDADAPNTVNNFITLAQKGFYDNLIFHRVIQGFMIQGGDPTGTGMGGPGYKFADELNPSTDSYKAGYARGTVAMANSGPNTNGSQFFIMHKDTPLPHNYSIFGKVISGLDVIDAIATTPVGPNDKPVTPMTMTKVTVAAK